MLDVVQLVEDKSLKATDSGFEFQLRLKWYRSLPLSCVDKLKVSLDGAPVNPALLRFSINGHSYRLEELVDLVEEFWFVQDAAVVSVQQAGSVKTGESHKLDVELSMRFPYIPIGPGRFLTIPNFYSAAQVAS